MTMTLREPAVWTSHLPRLAGKTYTLTDIARVTHHDGSVSHECACGFVSTTVTSVIAHRARKHPNAPKQRTKKQQKPQEDVRKLLVNALDKLDQIDSIRVEVPVVDNTKVEQWKARALDAERRLNSMRKALSA